MLSRQNDKAELWRIGETGAAVEVRKLAPDGFYRAFAGAGRYLFIATDKSVWRSDGTTNGTLLLSEKPPTCPFATTGETAFWFSFDQNAGYTLWRSDGTPAGTQAVITLPYASQCSTAAIGGKVYFTGFDAAHGKELWVSDGTAAATHLAQDIMPDTSSSDPAELTVAGEHIFFSASSPNHGRELWAIGPHVAPRRRSVGR